MCDSYWLIKNTANKVANFIYFQLCRSATFILICCYQT